MSRRHCGQSSGDCGSGRTQDFESPEDLAEEEPDFADALAARGASDLPLEAAESLVEDWSLLPLEDESEALEDSAELLAEDEEAVDAPASESPVRFFVAPLASARESLR